MAHEKPVLKVLSGTARQEVVGGRRSQIEAAYDHFRIDRQSSLVPPSPLRVNDHIAIPGTERETFWPARQSSACAGLAEVRRRLGS